MATLSIGIATSAPASTFGSKKSKRTRFNSFKVSCVNWDPEGILGSPKTGHLARLEFKRRLEKDSEAREAFEQHLRDEKERRKALRQSREIPDTPGKLIEFFLDTEAQEIEFEIARLRHRYMDYEKGKEFKLDEGFFSHLKFEIGQIRFAVSKTEAMEDRLIELEALQKALQEGAEAYDKMQADLVTAKTNLTKILTSKDIKATLLEMVERNELNRSLLTLLDENIATANMGNQKQAAEFMEKIRGAVLKYLTV